jgi:hypothetical protein
MQHAPNLGKPLSWQSPSFFLAAVMILLKAVRRAELVPCREGRTLLPPSRGRPVSGRRLKAAVELKPLEPHRRSR